MTKPEGWEVDYLSRVRLRIVNLGEMDKKALTHIESLLEGICGLTREDVRRLRSHADWYEGTTQDAVYACPQEDIPAWQLRDLARRIEERLPPKEVPDAD